MHRSVHWPHWLDRSIHFPSLRAEIRSFPLDHPTLSLLIAGQLFFSDPFAVDSSTRTAHNSTMTFIVQLWALLRTRSINIGNETWPASAIAKYLMFLGVNTQHCLGTQWPPLNGDIVRFFSEVTLVFDQSIKESL